MDAGPVIELVDRLFSDESTDILAYQRVAGNAHERDALNAALRKVQARLPVTEDDDEFDALVAERKAIKSRLASFVVIPDSYDYAPTGRTVAQMWSKGDGAVKRAMVTAVRDSWGLSLSVQDSGDPLVSMGKDGADFPAPGKVADLGNGLCFRRPGRPAA